MSNPTTEQLLDRAAALLRQQEDELDVLRKARAPRQPVAASQQTDGDGFTVEQSPHAFTKAIDHHRGRFARPADEEGGSSDRFAKAIDTYRGEAAPRDERDRVKASPGFRAAALGLEARVAAVKDRLAKSADTTEMPSDAEIKRRIMREARHRGVVR